MKKLFGLILLSVLALSASTATNDSKSLNIDSMTGIVDTASDLVSLFDKDKKVKKGVESLLGGLKADDALKAVNALKGLSSLEFSKDQLGGYGTLLAQVAPMILSQSFDLENGEIGKYVSKAIKLVQIEDFVKASKAVKTALKYVDTNSLQQDVLNGLISSYAPMLKNIDVDKAVDMGKSILEDMTSSPAQ